MKFALAPEHRDFFQRNRVIEFEGLVSMEQIESVLNGRDQVMSDRLDLSLEQVHQLEGDALFGQGRDLWRSDAGIKGLVLQKSLGEIAGELVDARPIRIGYDQLLPAGDKGSFSQYNQFLSRQSSLKELSSLQGVLCGLILCVEGNDQLLWEANSNDQKLGAVFPTMPGHGVFVHGDVPIDFSLLRERPGCHYLLIVYTHSITAYIHKKDDPHHHFFRNYGYSIGDPLTNLKNPIVYR